MLLWAAEAFQAAASIDAIAAVVPAEEIGNARRFLGGLAKLRAIVAGGARRQDSVRAGLDQAPADFDGVVLVHDAARPFVEPALIDAVTAAALEHGAALPVLPVVDTIKRVRDGFVTETVERNELFGAQTPQGFRFRLLTQACADGEAAGLTLTDECMAVERAGHRVRVVAGTSRNRKLTTPADLEWAEALLRDERERVRA